MLVVLHLFIVTINLLRHPSDSYKTILMILTGFRIVQARQPITCCTTQQWWRPKWTQMAFSTPYLLKKIKKN